MQPLRALTRGGIVRNWERMWHNGINKAIGRTPLLDYPFRAGCARFYSPFGNLDRASTIDQKSQSKAEAWILYSLVSLKSAPPIVLVENRLFKRYTGFLKKWAHADAVGPGAWWLGLLMVQINARASQQKPAELRGDFPTRGSRRRNSLLGWVNGGSPRTGTTDRLQGRCRRFSNRRVHLRRKRSHVPPAKLNLLSR